MRCTLLICLIYIIDHTIISFWLEPVNYFGHYANIDLKKSEGKVDTVFLGSSWTYFGYNCQQYDEQMGTVSFNAGSMGQSPIDSYYYLLQIMKKNRIKTVYYNLHHLKLQQGNSINSSIVNNRLTGINKLEHFIATANKDTVKYILKSYQYKDLMKNVSLRNVIRQKLNLDYINGVWHSNNDGQDYAGMGYIESTLSIKQGNNSNFILSESTWKEEDILALNLKYLDKMILLCKENDIDLIFLTPPFSVGFLQASKGYGAFSSYIEEFVCSKDIKYIDFNKLVHSPYLNDELFTDTSHVNAKGAEILTNLLCGIMNGSPEIKFFRTFSENQDVYKYVGGVYLEAIDNNGGVDLKATVPDEVNLDVRYRFMKYNDESEQWEILKDYGNENTYYMSDCTNSTTVRVECKNATSEKKYDAYSELKVERQISVKLNGQYERSQNELFLTAESEEDDILYCFSQWQPDGSYTIIQNYSTSNICRYEIPLEGMYQFKVEIKERSTEAKVGEAIFFIDTTQVN